LIKRGRARQCVPDLRLHEVGLVVDVRGREAQKTEPGAEQPILPAIVFDQAVAMVRPVVLEDETRRWVVQVDPSKDPVAVVAEIRLDFRAWKAELEEKPSKAGAASAARVRSFLPPP
jgi:hypothetical protein